MSISTIPPAGSIAAFAPVDATNALPTVSNAVTTSTTIAQAYGFAPSLIVPIYQPAFYQPYNENPDVVTGVSRIKVIPRIGQNTGSIFDAYA
jgi:hypothetical protein